MSNWPSRQSRLAHPIFLLALVVIAPAMAFDLGGIFTRLSTRAETFCPPECRCKNSTAERIMQRYVTTYLPDMGVHMQPMLEENTRLSALTMTAWLGTMADIQCQLDKGARQNLTHLLGKFPVSFKALRVKCDNGATIVWDVSVYNVFVDILDFSGCTLQTPPGANTMGVPINLWILDLNRVNPRGIKMLDFSLTSSLWALRITNSSLRFIPESLYSHSFSKLLHLHLSNNKLTSYDCQFKVKFLRSLNLEGNLLMSVPTCLLDGSHNTAYMSLKNNLLLNIERLLENGTDWKSPIPRVTYMNLAFNNLTYVGKLRSIKRLISLDLSHNHLATIDKQAFSLHTGLTWLDLSNNFLQHLPDGVFARQRTLNYLNISHNRLQAFTFDQSPISSNLVTMDLRHNSLRYPPFADSGFVAPRRLNTFASCNPFRCDCDMSGFLDLLTFANTTQQRNWFGVEYWNDDPSPKAKQQSVDTNRFLCQQPQELAGMKVRDLDFQKECPLLRSCPAACHCKLLRTGFSHVFVNCTNARKLSSLPAEVPLVGDKPVILHLSGSGVKSLEYRPYLHLVVELHVVGTRLQTVTPEAMKALENVTVLALNGNRLRSLPAVTLNLTFQRATKISLHGNPWTCGCQDLWMPTWMALHGKVLAQPSGVRCRWTGKPVNQFTPSDLSCGMYDFLPLMIGVFFLFGISVLLISVFVKYRLEVLVFFFTRFRLRPFDMFRYEKQRTLFDVFVSFSQHDCRWVLQKLVDHLENRENPYKLCIHLRDFPVDTPVADNIAWAIDNSRCTLLVLTRDFLSSEWCRFDFRAAHASLFADPKSKLLIVVRGPLDARCLDRDLRTFIRTHTFLRTDDKWFWSKLEYAVPEPQGNLVPPGPAPAPVEGLVEAGRPDIEKLMAEPAGGDTSPSITTVSV